MYTKKRIDLNFYCFKIFLYYFLKSVSKERNIPWIKPADDICLILGDGVYENSAKIEDMSLQNPNPLSRTYPQYKCAQLDVSPSGQGASVGIASCSPLKPTPTCSLLRDYYTWLPKMKCKNRETKTKHFSNLKLYFKLKVKSGNTIGWVV